MKRDSHSRQRPPFRKPSAPPGKRPENRPSEAGREKRNLPRPSIYGIHAVTEAVLNPQRKVEGIYLSAQMEGVFEAVLAKAAHAGLKRPKPAIVEKEAIDNMLPRGAVHQGVALVCAPLDEVFLQDILIRGEQAGRSVVMVLDQVTDPHNVGAIMRSASAFGASGIVMQRKHAPELSGVLAKTACGALEHIPVCFETNLSRTLEALKDEGFTVYGLDERGEKNLSEAVRETATQKSVLVLGAEGEGMRRLVREHCDVLARLPTQGAIQSLNVSNAAAVALYALLHAP